MIPLSCYRKIKLGANVPADFATCSCLRPKKIDIVDSETGLKRQIYVSCGKCYRCRGERRNQWSSRMILHSFAYQHCYLITLTYGSYNLHQFERHPFKQDWLDTFPILDSWNQSRKPAWTPSIIRHEHLTKFFKRLRKVTGYQELSYAACGEIGDNFGRPHFHVILWSKQPISYRTICEAWSLRCVALPRKNGNYDVVTDNGKYDKNLMHFRFSIGHVDCVDLVANHTLDPHLDLSDPQNYDKSAHKAFAYVAKYIGKQTDNQIFDSVSSKPAYQRYKRAFAAMPVSPKCALFDSHYVSVPYRDTEGKKQHFVEKKSERTYQEYLNDDVHLAVFDSEKTIDFNYNGNNYENIDFFKFATICGPFFVCSRTYAIGKQYALENLSRFKEGNFELPEFQGKKLVFPSYFLTMVQNTEYPLRFEKCLLRGKSLTRGSLPIVREFFDTFRNDKNIVFNLGTFDTDSCPFLHSRRVGDKYLPYHVHTGYHNVNDFGGIDGNILHGDMLSIVMLDPQHGQIHYYYNLAHDTFEGYVYNRYLRDVDKYQLYNVIDRIDFCDMVLYYIDKKWSDLKQRQKRQQLRLELMDMVQSDPRTPIQIETFLLDVQNQQINYKSNHYDPC